MTESATPTAAALPEANLAIVTAEVRRAVRRAEKRRSERGPDAYNSDVILLRAAPAWPGAEWVTVGGTRALVVPAPTVLTLLDAMSRPRKPGEYLVILTPCEDLGDSVLARVVGREVRPINRWDLVAEGFGVKRLDPRLYDKDKGWLAEALLDAEPTGGWRNPGPVLLYDTAMRALCDARMGAAAIDAAALLSWSRDDTQVARFTSLRDTEQQGIAEWLEETVGPVARVVFRLFAHGHATDAVPVGLAVAPLFSTADTSGSEAAIRARVRAEERYFGGQAPSPSDLRAFGEAVQSQVQRWQEGRDPRAAPAAERAEELLTGLDAVGLAAASPILDTGLDARLLGLADAIKLVLPQTGTGDGVPAAGDLGPIEEWLDALLDHRRREDRAGEVEAAHAAVRLTRWLTTEEPEPRTVAEGIRGHLWSWAWVDRALALLWSPDTSRVPRVAGLYERLTKIVRERRAALDEAFADRLAAWTGSGTSSDGVLLVENILERVARPVAKHKAPVIIVVDGMSAADGHTLAEEIVRTGAWTEYGREWKREAALTVIPSITRYGRTSLFSGILAAGGQGEEIAGFTAFWRGRKTRLFHKAQLAAGAGARLHPDVSAAIKETSTIVGAVLNSIDDALDRGRDGDDPIWHVGDIRHLKDLLAAARDAGRPVILTSDHGHIIDHGDTKLTEPGEGARYRTGAPGAGELLMRGARVLAHSNGGGSDNAAGPGVVVPWSERVRYIPRKSGYHGGVSAAEMVVPVIVLAPSEAARMPPGWSELDPRQHAPDWWDMPVTVTTPDTVAGRPAPLPGKSRKKAAVQDETLFVAQGPAAPAPAETLGRKITDSDLMRSQRAAVRNAPPAEETAALIDGLAQAQGRLSVTSAASLVDKAPARMSGYVAQTARLLNVDGYPVIGLVDGGRTVQLDVALLREQFLGETG